MAVLMDKFADHLLAASLDEARFLRYYIFLKDPGNAAAHGFFFFATLTGIGPS